MQYSDEFKQKVLSLKKINKDFMADLFNRDYSGDLVGRLLNQYKSVSAKDIIAAYENNDFHDIYEQAKDKLAAEKLYEEWLQVYYPQLQHEFYGINTSEKSNGKSK